MGPRRVPLVPETEHDKQRRGLDNVKVMETG